MDTTETQPPTVQGAGRESGAQEAGAQEAGAQEEGASTDKSSGEAESREPTRELLAQLKTSAGEYWGKLSERERTTHKVIGGIAAAAVLVAGTAKMTEDTGSQPEQVGNNLPVIDTDAGNAAFLPETDNEKGAFGIGNTGSNKQLETTQPHREREIEKVENSEVIARETITYHESSPNYPEGTEIIKEWYNPYAYSKTIILPGDDSEPEAVYQEASSEPLAEIDHSIYEYLTGVSYGKFLKDVKKMAPEIGGDPYNAKDVVEAVFQRETSTFSKMDPRYIEAALHPESEGYARAHEEFKRIYENDADEPPFVVIRDEVTFNRVTHKQIITGGVVSNPEDLNISRAHSFTANIGLKTVSQHRDDSSPRTTDYGELQLRYVRQPIPGIPQRSGGLFVIKEE